jgi:hypothetical protein
LRRRSLTVEEGLTNISAAVKLCAEKAINVVLEQVGEVNHGSLKNREPIADSGNELIAVETVQVERSEALQKAALS